MAEKIKHHLPSGNIVALTRKEHILAHGIEDDMEMSLNAICLGTKEAELHGLEAEVILSAMLALKRNPKMLITKAMETGVSEWIK